MKGFGRIFLIWFVAITAVWTFANRPRDGGSIKRFLEWAGFPWTFAYWEWGRLQWFDTTALVADIALGIGLAIVIAGICAWSRCRYAKRRGQQDVCSRPAG